MNKVSKTGIPRPGATHRWPARSPWQKLVANGPSTNLAAIFRKNCFPRRSGDIYSLPVCNVFRDSIFQDPYPGNKVEVASHIYTDMEIWRGRTNKASDGEEIAGFFERLNFSHSIFGLSYLFLLFEKPLADTDAVRKRQEAVNELACLPIEKAEKYEALFDDISHYQRTILEYTQEVYENWFCFGKTKLRAGLTFALKILLMPLTAWAGVFFFPALISLNMGLFIGFCLSGFAFMAPVFSSGKHKVRFPENAFTHLKDALFALFKLYEKSKILAETLKDAASPQLCQIRKRLLEIINSAAWQKLVEEFDKYGVKYETFWAEREAYKIRLRYKFLARYFAFVTDTLINDAKELVNLLGNLESMFAQAKANHYYGLHPAAQSDAALSATNFWPLLPARENEVITNSLVMDPGTNIMLITGATFSGKSAATRWFPLASIFMHQTGFGVPAAEAALPVFDEVITNINDEDTIIGGKSGFTGHAESMQKIIERIKANEAVGKKTLLLLDEIWRITNPIESMALILAFITTYLAPSKNTWTFLATHYRFVPEWLAAKQVPRILSVKTIASEEYGRPVFTYKIEPGISGDQLSVSLLRRMDFDDPFLTTADRIKEELTTTLAAGDFSLLGIARKTD